MSGRSKSQIFAGIIVLAVVALLLSRRQTPAEREPTVATEALSPAPSPRTESGATEAGRAPATELAATPPAPPAAAAQSPRSIAAPPPASVSAVTAGATTTSTNGSEARSEAASGFRFAAGPADGPALVQSAMDQPTAQRVMAPPPSGEMQIKSPLPVYAMNMPAIAAGGGLETAQATKAYDYLVESAGQFVVLGVVGQDDAGPSRLNSFGQAALAQTLGSALQQLAELDQVKAGSYEPRVIQLPGLFGSGTTSLLWLKSNAAGPDLLCLPATSRTLAPNFPQAGKAYPADEFFRLLQVIAQNKPR